MSLVTHSFSCMFFPRLAQWLVYYFFLTVTIPNPPPTPLWHVLPAAINLSLTPTALFPSSPARTRLIGYSTARPQPCEWRSGAKMAQPTYCARNGVTVFQIGTPTKLCQKWFDLKIGTSTKLCQKLFGLLKFGTSTKLCHKLWDRIAK